MAAYVQRTLLPSTTTVRVTAGLANVVEGPRVWEAAGCRVESYVTAV